MRWRKKAGSPAFLPPMKKALLLLTLFAAAAFAAVIPESAKVGHFFAGCQAYSFRLYTVFEAMDKTVQAGGKTIEFYLDRSSTTPPSGITTPRRR